MKHSLFPLLWCYVAIFALGLLAFHVTGVQDPNRIATNAQVAP